MENNIKDFNLLYSSLGLKKTKFSQLKDQLETGDIILVDGKYSYSTLMDILQGSRWGHGAMVVRTKDINNPNGRDLPDPLLWESNVLIADSAKNLWGNNNNYKEGPMLVGLEQKLRYVHDEFDKVVIAYRPLKKKAKIDYSILPSFFDKMINKSFPEKNIDIIKSVLSSRFQDCPGGDKLYPPIRNNEKILLDTQSGYFAKEAGFTMDIEYFKGSNSNLVEIPFNYSKDPNRIYCTELIAETYKELRLIKDCPVSHSFVPKDFSNKGKLKFLNNARLGKEIILDILN